MGDRSGIEWFTSPAAAIEGGRSNPETVAGNVDTLGPGHAVDLWCARRPRVYIYSWRSAQVPITLALPEPLTGEKAKFISMSRVVNGVREYDWSAAKGEDVREVFARQLATKPFKQRRPIPATASQLLRVAWQTELTARLGEQLDEPGLRLATLQTLPVQAYYAIFNAGRALSHTAVAPKDSHAAIHDTFAKETYRRAPCSWGVQLTGDPADPSACILMPSICIPTAFNPMEARSDQAEYVWAALRMARRWRLEAARKRWLQDRQNRTRNGKPFKNLPSAARTILVASERATTLMDFLYELRCSTNYRSVDEYTVDIEDDYVRLFHGGLMHLLDLGLLCLEGQIALYAGSGSLTAEFASWATRVRAVGPWATESGQARMDALSAAGI
jgi:hypothetical protein